MKTKYKIGEKVSMRDAYGNYLAELGDKYENIFVLDADLGCSTKANIFGKKFPERYRNVGISETFMQTKAAGIASEGYKAFTNTFAVFVVKGAEKIKQSIAIDKRDVKIIGTHGGISVGEDGFSHQGINDISVMRSIPGIYVFCPEDAVEVESMLDFMMTDETPTYMRISRNKLPTIHTPDYVFCPGKASMLIGDHAGKRDDKWVTIISYGDTIHTSIEAAKLLEKYGGVNPFVLSMSSIKPLDDESIEMAKCESDLIVTVEDHVLDGGLGEAVSRKILGTSMVGGRLKKLLSIGLDNIFAESGSWKELYEKYGFSGEKIKSSIIRDLKEIS